MMKEQTARREGSKRTRAKAAVAASCAALLALGAVMAALTATDTAVNRFELAEGLDVEVAEAAWDASPDADGDGVPDAAEGLLPTQEVAKDPKVINSTTTEAYIFCEVEVPIRHVATANADGTLNDAADVELFAYEVNDGWTLKGKVESEDGMSATYRYAWESTVMDGETGTLFDKVSYANVADDGLSGADLLQELVVTGHGVQALGFEDADAAYEALFGPIAPAATLTLTFDMGDTGMAQIGAIEIGEGKVAAEPEASAAEGYEVKWWKDASHTVEWDWTAPVTSSATVYVTSTALPAKIVFEANGGTAVAAIEGVTGQDLGTDTDLPTTEIEGESTYMFDAWYTKNGAAAPAALSAEGPSEEDAWGHPVTSMAYFKYSMPAGTTTLYARYVDTTDTSKTPFAVFDETDGSLSLYKRAASEIPSVGESYDGHTASKVYTGEGILAPHSVADSSYLEFDWHSIAASVRTLKVVDPFQVSSMNEIFRGFVNMTQAEVSNLNVSKATSARFAFQGCQSLTALDVSNWNVKNIQNMDQMFGDCKLLKELDVSNWQPTASSAYGLFRNCINLISLDLSSWDTSRMVDISGMFEGCTKLGQIDLSTWDTSHVVEIGSMFSNCSSLKSLDLSHFDTSKVTSFSGIFGSCKSLTEVNISNWSTAGVDVVSKGAAQVRLCFQLLYVTDDLPKMIAKNWDVPSWSKLIVCGLTSSGHIDDLDASGWTIGQDAKIDPASTALFYYNDSANNTGSPHYCDVDRVDLSGWIWTKTSSTSMRMLATHTSCKTLILNDWQFDRPIKDLYGMFFYSTFRNLEMKGWDVSTVTTMDYMFDTCPNLTQLDVSNWNTSSVLSMSRMFYNCKSIQNLDLSNWSVSKVSSAKRTDFATNAPGIIEPNWVA